MFRSDQEATVWTQFAVAALRIDPESPDDYERWVAERAADLADALLAEWRKRKGGRS